MSRLVLLVFVAACAVDPAPEEIASTTQAASVTRERVAGDVYHYSFALRVGSGPNAVLHLDRVVRERAPWVPRHSTAAVMMLHGDFSTFATNFLPGLAPWLAARGIDVWGVDRRWAHAGDDTSDFAAMGLGQELDDIGAGLAFARATRLVTDGSVERMTLIGFSRGGELAYFYASREATRAVRHVKGIVPLDVYASVAPEDEELRQFFCDSAYYEGLDLDSGVVDYPNVLQIGLGQGTLSAPDEQNPFQDLYPGFTNRQAMQRFVGRTYRFFAASPFYHLNGWDPLGSLLYSPEPTVATWLANATAHQAVAESVETDAMTCGDEPPLDLPLSRIHVPLLLIAAAGGYGDHAVYSTTQVASTDVTTRVIRLLPADQEPKDFGHADLLFSPQAPTLAWQPLLAWLAAH